MTHPRTAKQKAHTSVKPKPKALKPVRIQGHPGKILRDHGYEPMVVDATEPLEFEIPKNAKWRRGLIIGDPNACSAAKGCKDIPEVADAFILAKMAIIVFNDGRQIRYRHDGLIPKSQDEFLMTPPGTYSLRPVPPSLRMGSALQGRTGTRDGSRGPLGPRKVSTAKGTVKKGRPVGSKTKNRSAAAAIR